MAATPEQNNSARRFFRDRAVDVAGGWGEQVFNPGEFLRRDLSGGEIGPQIDQAIGRGFCRRWARTGKTGILPGRNAYYSSNCRGYLEDIGEWPGDGFAGPNLPGGQCAGVGYSVNHTGTALNYPGPVEAPFDRTFSIGFGPIVSQNFTSTQFGRVNNGVNIEFFDGPQPGAPKLSSQFTYTSFDNQGRPTTVGGAVRIFRNDGLPDECGNQPAEYEPNPELPSPAPPFEPTAPNPWGGPDINLDIDINPDGTINIDLPDFPGNPLDPIDPENPDPGGGDRPPALPPGDQGNPGGSGTTGDGGEEEGEAPPGQVLVGLLLELITIPIGAKEFGPGIYRGPAWIYMGGDAGLDQDFAGSCLAETQFVNAETENATKWRVRANIGYNIRVTPYYREVEE